MGLTVVYLSTYELFVATCAPKLLEPGKHFPENVLPRHLFLPEVDYKLIDVPMLVRLMLSNDPSVSIYKKIGFGALLPFPLPTSVESAAVDTTMKHVMLLLKQKLEFFHV